METFDDKKKLLGEQKKRLNEAYSFLKYKKVIGKHADVAIAMGASESNISSALHGNVKVLTPQFLTRFSDSFKQISRDWLIWGNGQMLSVPMPEFKSENTPIVMESIVDKDVIAEQAKMTARIMELMRDTRHLPETFALEANIEVSLFADKKSGKKAWSVADVHKICDAFKVRKGWLVDGEGQKYRLPDEVMEQMPARRSYDARVGVPYYNVDFELGFDFMVDEKTVNPDYMIDFSPYNKCDAWCNARGDSMRPTIGSGDIIALKEVYDPSCLINGEIYAIVTTNDLRTIKRVRDNGDTITLIPDNKDVDEQIINKSMLRKVYRVVGLMKMF